MLKQLIDDRAILKPKFTNCIYRYAGYYERKKIGVVLNK